mgnify:CR=1 FL=1
MDGQVLVVQDMLGMAQERFGVDLSSATKVLDDSEAMVKEIYSMASAAMPQIVASIGSVASNFVAIFTSIAASIYMLADKDHLLHQLRTLAHAFLPEKVASNTLRICHYANVNFTGFFVGKIIDSAIIGVITFVCMTVLRLDFAVLISVFIGITNIIPVFGPFIGALARSMGGAISDRLGGTRVTLVNFVVMAVFCALLFLTLPTNGQGGNFIAFFAVFMVLFLTAGLGSASTFQMISVIFRKLTMDRVKAQGGSEAQAMREAATDTAAALGFISAIGAIGGFFIPKAFGISLDLTGSPAGAMKVFLVFYIACVVITWAVYGRKRQ